MLNTTPFLDHHFELADGELAHFQRFLTLFMDYNSHTNLSAIRDEAGIVEKHFVDSLYGASLILESVGWTIDTQPGDQISKSKHLSPRRLLDIGSGWGFPGIPLKIAIPELHVTLLDSVGKKVKAMQYFVHELWLEGIWAIQERAEILAKHPDHALKYDIVVSRATAYMNDILTWAVPFLKKTGKIILYKMPSEDEKKEISKISKRLKLILEWELEYTLDGKDRILYIFSRIR